MARGCAVRVATKEFPASPAGSVGGRPEIDDWYYIDAVSRTEFGNGITVSQRRCGTVGVAGYLHVYHLRSSPKPHRNLICSYERPERTPTLHSAQSLRPDTVGPGVVVVVVVSTRFRPVSQSPAYPQPLRPLQLTSITQVTEHSRPLASIDVVGVVLSPAYMVSPTLPCVTNAGEIVPGVRR